MIISVSVTEIDRGAFCKCTSLTLITIPEGVTEISEKVFCKCNSLTQINIPEGVTEIGEGAFARITSLAQINIPDGVTEISEKLFWECTNLTQIIIPGSVTEIGGAAFCKCTSLTQINIPEGVTKFDDGVFGCGDNLQRLLVSNNNEAVRVKACLSDELKDKVTSYYLQHQQNLNKIRRSQLALCLRPFNLFRRSLNNDVAGLTYQFLSFEDIISLSCIYTGLKPIKDIAQSIQAVKYRGIIPRIKPKLAVKTSFLQQYTPNMNDKELTDYHRSLNQYKWNLRKSISVSLSELKINNNEEKNDGRMLCRPV